MTDQPPESDHPPESGLPRLALLREMTDQAVLTQLLRQGEVTRAELAATTGISKPTISESVRRLAAAGRLSAVGARTGLRGRVATVYRLAADVGWVLALQLDQDGIAVRATDLAARSVLDQQHPPGPSGDAVALAGSLRVAVEQALTAAAGRGPLGAVAISVANPVDPRTHRVIEVARSPFPEGFLQPTAVLADLVDAPVLVENDVNLATMAERRSGAGGGVRSFVYLHVGSGFGLGVALGDELVRGAHGLAGEIGFLPMTSALAAEPVGLTEMFTGNGFGRPDGRSVDTLALRQVIDGAERGEPAGRARLLTICALLGHALTAVCLVVDPDLVLIGGPLGAPPVLLAGLREAVGARLDGPVRIEAGALGPEAPLLGALELALTAGRARLLSSPV